MAEFAVFSLASKVLSTIASPALQKAYEKGCSVWDARDDLDKLRATVETIHAVLLDAEKKQEGSAAVRNWIKRVKGVLYDADDLFDEIPTDDMFMQQIKGNKHLKKVWVSCSKLNPITSNSIANKVKAIRKSLLEISADMEGFKFVESVYEQPISSIRERQDPGCFVDSNEVIGRDEDKKALLEMLLYDQPNNVEKDVSVIAVVGIGGMGKTTLAQLVYNDEEVQRRFAEKWFACISDTFDDKEIVGKIFQSICEESYSHFTVGQLQTKIRRSIEGQKFLLVLDDVWDDSRGNWIDRIRLLGCGAKGSKIVVTTRLSSVAGAMDALKTHSLDGLSEDDSWNLFKRIAFKPEQEKDSGWTNLGRKIVKKCANVPLAIKSIGSLLYTKSTMQEWESFSKEELPKLGQNGPDPIMPILKLSYDHLNSNLKQCFAYCSLFPKDYEIRKQELIYLWMAQGYIKSNNVTQSVEEVGHSYFMDLLRRSFFQETGEDDFGEIEYCKMHDLVHDLAQHVAGEESIMLTESFSGVKAARHVSVELGYVVDDSLPIPVTTFNVHQLRSFLVMCTFSVCTPSFVHEAVNLKFLRSLSLSGLEIENVPHSVGELKHLRYLDISQNRFKNLPDSITKLLNLCTLNISGCEDLETLPNDFRKLINLRHLENWGCGSLKYMPPGFEELTSLQRLDEFKVGGGGMSKLHALEGLRLTGVLSISFEDDTNDDWDGVECWQPPVNLQTLTINKYQGRRIPKWGNGSKVSPTLVVLRLSNCSRVKCLPSFRHLPNLKSLHLSQMEEMEYIEEDDGATDSGALFLPRLEKLQLWTLPKLEGWGRKVGGAATRNDKGHSSSTSHHLLHSFPSLSYLDIYECPELKWMPLCPCLERLKLSSVNAELIPQLLSTRHSSPSTISSSSSSSLKHLEIRYCNGLTTLPGESLTSLEHLEIKECNGLTSLPAESLTSLKHLEIAECNGLTSLPAESLTSLSRLSIRSCRSLKDVVVAPSHLNLLKNLRVQQCPQLELWEEEKRGVDWDSLPNLRQLTVDQVPTPERLPNCLRIRQADGKLKITRPTCQYWATAVNPGRRRYLRGFRRRIK